MKNMMQKSTFREIRGSLSRWIAILAIVALGVGFFTGLKVSREAFLATGDKYVNNRNLFDFQLISTLGFEDENVEEIAAVDGVNKVIGSRSTDAVVNVSGTDYGDLVTKIHTINDTINTPELIAGKMPSAGNECLADSSYFSEDSIGQTITIVKTSNDPDAEEILAYREYTITGIGQSPLYMNYERGSTSLGAGTVSFFLLINEDGWDADYYTELYVDANAEGYIFSDQYNETVDQMEKRLETALEHSANGRYDQIMADAKAELADAEKKLADAKVELADAEDELKDGEAELKDAEEKLEDAEEKLADGEEELAENQQKLADAQSNLAQARADYEEGLARYNQEKADADAQLEDLLASIAPAKGTPYYSQYYAQYEAAKAEADAQFKAAWTELEEGRIKIEDGEREVADGLIAIEDAQKEIADGKAELADGKNELADGKKELEDGKKEIADAKKELADAEEELDDARDEIEDIENPDTYVLGRDTNIGYVCFDSDTAIVEGLAKIFPAFFFLVAALVVMTTMTRMIDEHRTQIGVLKALGYSKVQILGKYIFYSSSAAIMGGVVGFFVGSYLFPYVIWVAYSMMYGFAPITFVLNWGVGCACIAVALFCALSATLYSCYKELSEVPAQLIRPKAPALGKRILLERIHFIWDRLKFLHKVSLRNIFRYKKRFFMMVLGICGCTALLVTGFGVSDTIKTVVPSQYEEIYFVDYTVTFDKDINEDEKVEFLEENADVVSDALFLYTITADAQANGTIKTVNMVVAQNDDPIGDFIDLHTEDGQPLSYPQKGQCIVNVNLARMMHLEVGDELTV
ncbi:MAG: FtsX-like permease family protein, partial [Firmicutes bacterium]|nr:FtsX-like permease family protein [Bacillota bacterium]